VSEGCGLGEERLGGRRTEEREESGGAGQIPMNDEALVLERATGMSAWEGGARLRWLRRGREENGRNGDGMVAVAFEKRLSGARQRGKRGVGRRGRVHVEAGEGRKGGPGMAVGSSSGAVAVRTGEGGGHGRRGRTWLTSGTGARWDPVLAVGCGRAKGREAWRRWGADRWAWAARHRAA
jgi:hypothetical protein